jgi:hypothetical protein
MYELNCVYGCLPQELDEIMDSLENMRSDLQSNFESAEPEPTDKEGLKIFKGHIDAFKENIEHYKKYCLGCKKNGGKLKLYEEALKQVQDLWDLLSC